MNVWKVINIIIDDDDADADDYDADDQLLEF